MGWDIAAIDAVVNIWTPEALAGRPNREAFYKDKIGVDTETFFGTTLEEMLRQMDAAGIERGFLIAAKVGPAGRTRQRARSAVRGASFSNAPHLSGVGAATPLTFLFVDATLPLCCMSAASTERPAQFALKQREAR